MITEALKEALISLPHVQVVYMQDNGDWHINRPSRFETIEITREEILGEEIKENSEGNETKESKTTNKRK